MNKYLKIMRLDHWIKQFFILPGCIFAFLLTRENFSYLLVQKFILGFFGTCLIASSNYVINEWLDVEFDRFHPTKKNRSVVSVGVDKKIVYALWLLLALLGGVLGFLVNVPFFVMQAWLWLMGIVYNVKPLRTKDVPVLDVLSESINNAIRLLMGWFIVSSKTIPPSSIIIGYWMGGAFLMAIKRYAEYIMIGDKTIASSYRKSFKFYTEKSLLVSSFFYALSSAFFTGIFLIKYRVELIILMPFLMGLYCFYLWLSFKKDSAVQKPEKLYKEKGLMFYCLFLAILFVVLMFVDIPLLNIFTDSALVEL